jgi:hypothetical protein
MMTDGASFGGLRGSLDLAVYGAKVGAEQNYEAIAYLQLFGTGQSRPRQSSHSIRPHRRAWDRGKVLRIRMRAQGIGTAKSKSLASLLYTNERILFAASVVKGRKLS